MQQREGGRGHCKQILPVGGIIHANEMKRNYMGAHGEAGRSGEPAGGLSTAILMPARWKCVIMNEVAMCLDVVQSC